MYADWITCPNINGNEYGVYLFRKNYYFDQIPTQLPLKISADNRYTLYINGIKICYGPAKGDFATYKYDYIDVAPFISKGHNQFAVLVFNGGNDKPLAFVSNKTGLYIESDCTSVSKITTDSSWKVKKSTAYSIISYKKLMTPKWFYGFYACGGGDNINFDKYESNWEFTDFNDKNWKNARPLSKIESVKWHLTKRNIPFLTNNIESPEQIRVIKNAETNENQFLSGNGEIVVDRFKKATILFDFGKMTMGYPNIKFENGNKATIKVRYAESLYDDVNVKAHRDSVNGKKMFGVWDFMKLNGEPTHFRPLWQRSFRYVQFEISTNDQPLHIKSFTNEFSAYPYSDSTYFYSNNTKLNRVFEICMRSLKLCSSETYFDTPYYEQLCYGGDNRPIGLISYYTSTDDRLLREMLRMYPQSVNPETGLFKAAYPSRFTTDMGTWSLSWIQSMNDYFDMRNDTLFVKDNINAIEEVLKYFKGNIGESGLLEHIKTKNFIDWSINSGSLPRKDSRDEIHKSTLLTLFYVYTLDKVIELYHKIGYHQQAENWQHTRNLLKKSINSKCWNNDSGLYTDYPGINQYSQQTNILAVLCHLKTVSENEFLIQKILFGTNFTEKASSYFDFFLFEMLAKNNKAEQILENLDFWYSFLDKGLTACGETGFDSMDRSDCHAWSAHPAYYLLNSICGIQSIGKSFSNIIISPNLGTLTYVKSAIPTPTGQIVVEYQIQSNKLISKITIPKGIKAVWKKSEEYVTLKEGTNELISEIH